MSGTISSIIVVLAAVLGGVGVYLALPSDWHRQRRTGLVLSGAALVPLAVLLAGALGGFGVAAHFYVLAGLALIGAFLAITSRNPVYCALWFGLVLLSTAGLFLLIGAQFLAAATVVVYAGAILVTLLFVVMLAQQGGVAGYDRLSREPFITAIAATILAAALLGAVFPISAPEPPDGAAPRESVARLGATLFTDHLVSVEIAGTLLLVALVAAVCITGIGRNRGSSGQSAPGRD